MISPVTGSLTAVRVAGGLLPADVLAAVPAGGLDGLSSGDYHLAGESPREAAARVWTHLVGVYRRFRADLDRLPENDPAVGLTRERWLTALLSELGYGRAPLTGAGGLTVGDKQYPLSHLWGATPIHLLGWGVPLDKRTPGVAGAALRAPHAMVQELLNRSEPHLWAIVSNGRVLRLLRDSTTLTGQAYVEFDLEAMFDGELFAEFALLFLLAHESRVEVPDGGQPGDCWLERWRLTAVSQGVRALALLRAGVQQAMGTLGTGFLQHPANTDLRRRLDSGAIRLDDVHQSLLRVVYRLLFWAVAEDRDALLDPQADPAAAKRYSDYFSSARLRRLALRRHGTAHDDLWDAVTVVLAALARPDGEPRLALPGLGGLFSTTEADVLTGARLGNRPLLAATRSLSVVQPRGQPRRSVDFRHLGAEELGSIYESLLELVPRRDPLTQTFTLETLAGNDRKKSGSYYTPSDLVELVLDTALDPVLDDAEKSTDPETALLAVTVCDPAIGSGHFMVAAARRIATRLATARTGEVDPTPTTVQDAMHDVVARCIYGVDVNPMAADLAKVSLWLEAMSPGRPLSFLDHHIKVGNSLLGTTPALMRDGIPDTAYTALTGDDKSIVRAWKTQNFHQQSAQLSFLDEGEGPYAELAAATREVADRAESASSVADVAWAAQRYADLQGSVEMVNARRVADAWCAAFLAPKRPGDLPITYDVLGQLRSGTAAADVVAAVAFLAARHRLFHWHLEFPGIFRVPDDDPANTTAGWTGGFSAILSNPPFLNQLETVTTLHKPEQSLLTTTLAGTVRAYTDTSALFLQSCVQLTSAGGRIAMIQPQSFMAARDSGRIRKSLAQRCSLAAIWASDVGIFEANVLTCFPTLVPAGSQGRVKVYFGPGFQYRGSRECTSNQLDGEWSFLVSRELGVPEVAAPRTSGRLGDIASCTADFREQYYGLAPFIIEADSAQSETIGQRAPLVTTGLVEPAELLWGLRQTKFNKRSWAAPCVDLGRLRVLNSKLYDWACSRLQPKIMLATQSKIIEAVVDEKGACIPSVPLISVIPFDSAQIWRIASVLLSPPICAFAAQQFAGSGLTMTAIKLSAAQVRALPLPNPCSEWDEAAALIEQAHSLNLTLHSERRDLLVRSARLMCRAFGNEDGNLVAWWTARAFGDAA